jgi:hypothetical protein
MIEKKIRNKEMRIRKKQYTIKGVNRGESKNLLLNYTQNYRLRYP